jgi:hypothetical protein
MLHDTLADSHPGRENNEMVVNEPKVDEPMSTADPTEARTNDPG